MILSFCEGTRKENRGTFENTKGNQGFNLLFRNVLFDFPGVSAECLLFSHKLLPIRRIQNMISGQYLWDLFLHLFEVLVDMFEHCWHLVGTFLELTVFWVEFGGNVQGLINKNLRKHHQKQWAYENDLRKLQDNSTYFSPSQESEVRKVRYKGLLQRNGWKQLRNYFRGDG